MLSAPVPQPYHLGHSACLFLASRGHLIILGTVATGLFMTTLISGLNTPGLPPLSGHSHPHVICPLLCISFLRTSHLPAPSPGRLLCLPVPSFILTLLYSPASLQYYHHPESVIIPPQPLCPQLLQPLRPPAADIALLHLDPFSLGTWALDLAVLPCGYALRDRLPVHAWVQPGSPL